MKYLSVCSGIEASTVAWHPLGWDAVAYSEIDAFPSAVLAHHYPTVPNYGDMTRFKEWPDAAFDVLVGGTPCQSFSVAGLRKGLDDPRGSLMLVYLAIALRTRPRWLVWENVPGVLSADDGRAFGSLLGGLAELGYGFAYRVLDAQYFGLAQRRARVFVVGCLGDWRRAAAVLFERESLSGHPAPRRETGEVAPTIPSRRTGGGGLGTDFDCDGGLVQAFGGNNTSGPIDIATACQAHGGPHGRMDFGSETFIAEPLTPIGFVQNQREEVRMMDVAGALAGEPGMKQQTYIAFSAKDSGADAGELAPTLRAGGHDKSHANGGCMPAIAFAGQAGGDQTASGAVHEEMSPTLHKSQIMDVLHWMQVRRLTPRECERLQGFPDNYTLVPYHGKKKKPAKDGPRYKALGNSMAVPVMAWIGRRIQFVESVS